MLITLEGPDGSGKSTQQRLLVDFLTERGYEVVSTHEPGGTPIGEQVRQVIMDMNNRPMSPRAETLLFCAARAELVDELLGPALARGALVVCDRYGDSTLAYQGYGHGLDLDFLRRLLDFATGGIRPDLSLLLDLPAEEGLARKRALTAEWNRMDDYELAYHRRVRQGYLELVREEPERWRVLDAREPLEVVQARLRDEVLALLASSEPGAGPIRSSMKE
jgi:dTMP kinase